ncbi:MULTISPECIES: helix-turn-helix domain-containing protein [Pedobacter]|uniref:Helix-turn-helix domain protein n=1 Tax=Pedobacter heparinus (strain ATCC 13125 / DSM 2366 / CIP 104194 / JCM 7457 / NBRC 12017 / NCIMB 9290 / NRRL B-14731 / HIM 762-3) TaxID=485917 RepID=C6Y392_PEDHD|nr:MULTISPECIES: helix-turn-helix transcriptional regulator [Pedobacter]ACU05317.1 helix-turn-helix domain protein [Pedobacter heparinus DSM 2366]MBB5439548.1 transcriptional regulator with XRE-family HTH domain [Pedobacter sp. AK017]
MNDSTGKKIKMLRRQKKWAQKDMAGMLDISVPAYSKIECEITDINITRLIQVADVLGVEPCTLLPGHNGDDLLKEENKKLKEKLQYVEKEMMNLQAKLIGMYEAR